MLNITNPLYHLINGLNKIPKHLTTAFIKKNGFLKGSHQNLEILKR